MRFRCYDNLRIFDIVARHLSFTAAARELNRTKGAISYQIARLEDELGFTVFSRQRRGITLTDSGKKLWHASQAAFQAIERNIADLREERPALITVGMSTYFASRWLSPRLMNFLAAHPRTGLRLQPLIDPIDQRAESLDMTIRWGKGDWTDMEIEPLFMCPGKPTAGAAVAARIDDVGLQAALATVTLLHDRDGGVAWADWHDTAGLAYRYAQDGLVVPDPNVRVQAVIDGQGMALNDSLVDAELSSGRLFQISDVELDDYGYFLAYPQGALSNPELKAFRDWILLEAADFDQAPR